MKIAVYETDGSATLLECPVPAPNELRVPIHRNLTYLAQQGVAATYKSYRLMCDKRGTLHYLFTRQG